MTGAATIRSDGSDLNTGPEGARAGARAALLPFPAGAAARGGAACWRAMGWQLPPTRCVPAGQRSASSVRRVLMASAVFWSDCCVTDWVTWLRDWLDSAAAEKAPSPALSVQNPF
jgi:hypothetical protein